MATWQKVIISGSTAQLATLQLDNALGVVYGGTGLTAASASGFLVGSNSTTYTTVGSNGTGQVVRTTDARGLVHSGSFSGSFVGNGAGLTGLLADSTFTVYGNDGTMMSFGTATDVLKFNTASNHGFGFTVSETSNTSSVILSAPQDLRSTANVTFGQITGSGVRATSLAAGSTNTVIISDVSGTFQTRTVDARVWGTSLIDGAGANTRVAFYTDADTISSDSTFTFGSSVLTVNGSTFGSDVVVAGNLTVLGTTVNLNITNVSVEDRFILLNSGSSTGDGGIVVQTEANFSGSLFGWDDSATRWALQANLAFSPDSSSAIVPEAYISAVVDVDGGLTDIAYYQKNGNIKISGGEIFIYA